MGLRLFETLLVSYNYAIAIHDRLALFLKSLFLIKKNIYIKKLTESPFIQY